MSNKKIGLTIDGTRMEVPEGTTVMEAAAELGIDMGSIQTTSTIESALRNSIAAG